MPTSYSPLLGLALPVTGELAGTWGDTVNNYITTYLDSSVAGTQTISGSQTAVTLTRANGAALSQAGSGATGSSQYQVINCTGNPAGTLTVTIDVSTGSPALSNSTYSQTFAVINGTSTSQSVVVRATTTSGTSTGTTLVSGEKALIAWNGSDFIKVATSTVDGVSTIAFGTTGLTPSAATSGAVTVAGTLVAANGGTGQSSYTTGDLLYATGSTALSKLGIGTNGQILTSTGTAPQWSTLSGVAVTTFSAGTTGFTPSSATSGAITLAGTLATTNGGTGLTSFTANGVVYASSSSALTTGSALTFDGTNLSASYGIKVNTTGTVTSGFVNAVNIGTWDALGYDSGGTDVVLGGYRASQFGAISFYAAGSQQMRLTSTGLGIGTSSPAYKLDVSGEARVTSSTNAAAITATSATDNTGLVLINTATSGATWKLLSTGGASGYGQGALAFERNSALQMVINASGNLGIGTSSPLGIFNIKTSNGQFLVQNGTSANQMRISAFNNAGNANAALIFEGYSSEYGRFDSSGNLGLGVTPSASWANYKVLQIGEQGVISGFASGAGVLNTGANFYWDGSGYRYLTTNAASLYQQNAGAHNWRIAASGTAGDPISFTQAMTLDSSGRLLVGLTSSSLGSRLEVKSSNNLLAGFTGGDASGTSYFVNTNGSGQVNHYATWATAPGVNAYHAWWVTASGGSQTQAMTLDASGNLAVGATSTSYRMEVVAPSGDNITALFRSGDATAANNAGGGFRSISSATAASRIAQLWLDADGANFSGVDYFYIQKNGNSGTADIVQYSNAAMTFATNATERARITSGGDFVVAKTTANVTVVGGFIAADGTIAASRAGSTNATSTMEVYSTGASAYRFYVDMAGTVFATSTTISAISDHRFKENIQDLDAGLDAVMALKPRKFDWKDGKGKNIKGDRGFIAQEFEQVFPDLIDEWKDPAPQGEEPYKSVRQDLIPVLVKAIQEQQAIITDLRARVAQLEAK